MGASVSECSPTVHRRFTDGSPTVHRRFTEWPRSQANKPVEQGKAGEPASAKPADAAADAAAAKLAIAEVAHTYTHKHSHARSSVCRGLATSAVPQFTEWALEAKAARDRSAEYTRRSNEIFVKNMLSLQPDSDEAKVTTCGLPCALQSAVLGVAE